MVLFYSCLRFFTALFLLSTVVCVGCATDDDAQPIGRVKILKAGLLKLQITGGELVENGFVSEDGWTLNFDKVYVNIDSPAAYQVLDKSNRIILSRAEETLENENIPDGAVSSHFRGMFFAQLKQSTGNILLAENDEASTGNYNRLAFNIKKSNCSSVNIEEDYLRYSIVLLGNAIKESTAIFFNLKFDQEVSYVNCGPNGQAGSLDFGEEASALITIRLDRIFGNDSGEADTLDEAHVNYLAVGFEPFANLATDGLVDLDQQDMQQNLSNETYILLNSAVKKIGYSGASPCTAL